MKRLFTSLFLLFIAGQSMGQTFLSHVATHGFKYPVLEAAVGTWDGYTPDVAQNVYETIKPTYPRTIVAFWHGNGVSFDPMTVTGDPYCSGSTYITGFSNGTIDRAQFGGVTEQVKPFDGFIATQYGAAPAYEVTLTTDYDASTRVLTVHVKGTANATMTGLWRINAYVVEDSISSGLGPFYYQVDSFSGTSLLSCTGSPSWFASAPNPIASGAIYSHMNVVRAILAPGGNIWGDPAFSNPTAGTAINRTFTYTVPFGSAPEHMKVIGLVQKYGAFPSDRAIENAIETPVMPALAFAAGHIQTMYVCSGSPSVSIDSMLAVNDTSTTDTVTWLPTFAPAHGVLSASYSATGTGTTLVPTGLTYTPAGTYTGLDSFTVAVIDGTTTDTTKVYVTINPTPVPITGTLTVCAGDTVTLVDTTTGGLWTSTSTSVATVDTTGTVIGVALGTTTISYTLPTGCASTAVVTVNSVTVSDIYGANTICTGGTITLNDSTLGGKWISSLPFVAVVDSVTGVVTGVTSGIATISYVVTSICGAVAATWPVTVSATPSAGVITGPTSLCVGTHIMMYDPVVPGTWSATNTRAVVTSVGVVVGAVGGLDTVIYTATLSCGVATASIVITVNPLPATAPITGPDIVCVGRTAIFTDPETGAWSSTSGKVTFVSGGIVTGTSVGADTIKIFITNGCGSATATHPIFVQDLLLCELGTATIQNMSGLDIYPDPASSSLTISTSYKISSVVITDLTGHKLMAMGNATDKAVIDVSGLPAGIYLVRINDTITRKFVKQ